MQKPSLFIVGAPDWAATVAEQLGDAYAVHHARSGQYMKALIETRAALILVDGTLSDWAKWVTAPKVSAATRRIPIVVVSDDNAIRGAAAATGADLTFSRADLIAGLNKLVRDYARVPDPALAEQLDCECREPLPPLAVQGVAKFNAGEYYPQHDLFEEQWVNTEGPVRDLYRAVLQVGVAYYQIERGNYRGALKMLQRSVQWLVVLPDVCQGIDVKALREDSFRVRAELERLGEERFSEFDRSLIKGVKLVE